MINNLRTWVMLKRTGDVLLVLSILAVGMNIAAIIVALMVGSTIWYAIIGVALPIVTLPLLLKARRDSVYWVRRLRDGH